MINTNLLKFLYFYSLFISCSHGRTINRLSEYLELEAIPNIAVITADTLDDKNTKYSENYLHLSPEYANIFLQSKKDWASFQGYDLIHKTINPAYSAATEKYDVVKLRSVGIEKVRLIRSYLNQYDWICWIDMDTLVVDINSRLQAHISKALKSHPRVDMILEGNEGYKKMKGKMLRSGLMLIHSSFWTQNLFKKMEEALMNEEFERSVSRMVPASSSFDSALTFLLNNEHSVDSHIYFTKLQDRWNQNLVYFPKIEILHFAGCTKESESCLSVFDNAINHILSRESMFLYVLAPYIQHIYNIFAGIYILFALDRLYHIVGRSLNSKKLKNLRKVNLKSLKPENFPMVVIQLPMYNEISCCQTIIDCACSLKWPKDKLYVQVVDDSTDTEVKTIIDHRIQFWKVQGVDIYVHRRPHRNGFKAGAMADAMEFFPRSAEYVAIFDADFLPQPDFLENTMPYMLASPEAGFVQARWRYTNEKESLLTRMQEISLNFHFKCEQEMRFRNDRFFNFNGTAGVWRVDAIVNSGGWQTDTLVEDMDLSLRAWASGWKSIYLYDVTVLNEIPPTFSAYLGQQHRWTSGPMQVLKKAFTTVLKSKSLPIQEKIFCLWFFLRNYVHIVNFLYFLVLIPLMIWIPRVTFYEWAVIYLPAVISMTNILFTPSEYLYVVHYILFENSMCLYKTGALLCGIFNIGKANQWIVTPKFARKKLSSDITKSLDDSLNPALDYGSQKIGGLTSEPPSIEIDYSHMETTDKFHESISSTSSFETYYADSVASQADSGSHSPAEISSNTNDNRLMLSFSSSFASLNSWASPEISSNNSPSPKLLSVASAYSMSQLLLPTFKFLWREFLMALYLMLCGYFGILMGQIGIGVFCIINSLAYLMVSFSWIGRSG